MQMVEFFEKESGKIIQKSNDWLFIMNDQVYQDTFDTCESQSAVVGFDDFIKPRPDLGWRIIDA